MSRYHPDINLKGVRKTSGQPATQSPIKFWYLRNTQITSCLCIRLHRFALQHYNDPFLIFVEVSTAFIACSSFTLTTPLPFARSIVTSFILTLPPPSWHIQLSQVSCWPFHRLLCTFNCHKFHADLSTAFFAHSIVMSFMLTFPTPSLHVQTPQVSC